MVFVKKHSCRFELLFYSLRFVKAQAITCSKIFDVQKTNYIINYDRRIKTD